MLILEGNIRKSRENSSSSGTPKLTLKGNQDNFLKPKNITEPVQPSTSIDPKFDNQHKPTTRLSKLLSKSLSSEKSISSSIKEEGRVSEEPPTIVTSNRKLSGAEFLKDFIDDNGKNNI